MRFIELINGLSMPVSNEESELLDKIGNEAVQKKKLSDREQRVATGLVEKDALTRTNVDGSIFYKKRHR